MAVERVERAPMWVMRQAGRYLPEYNKAKGNANFFDVCRQPELCATITLQPIERYAGLIDGAIIFSDILVIPQALGMQVEMLEKQGPHFPHPIEHPDAIDLLVHNYDLHKSLGYVYKAITLTRQQLQGRVPLLGFVGAPWTLMAYMIEGGGSKTFQKSKAFLYRWPEASHRLLKLLAHACLDHLVLQIQAGAQMVQVFDSWAGELAPAEFDEFSLPYLRFIREGLDRLLPKMNLTQVPRTVFAKGAWYALDALCSLGYEVVSLDWTHAPEQAVAVRGDRRVVFQGNMDPNVLYGGHDAIRSHTERMIAGFGGGHQGYILNLGHGITPGVNPDDLRFYFEEGKRVSSA